MKNIVFENVKKAYGKNVVVEDLCMEVKEGERLILLGPSGCGKSTTLRMIAGLENVTAGNLWMRDQVVNDVPCGERGVSMVFQNYALFPHMSVKNNIIYGLKAHKMDENEIDVRLKEVLKMLELGIIPSLPRVFGVQSEHADPVYRYYAAPKDARVWQPVTVTPSVAQAAMIGNPVSFPRVQRLAEKFIEKGGEKAFQVVQVTEQQIMDAMIVANRHGHIACTQGGECLAGLVNARALGLVGDDEHAVLDATAHALKFSGFQDMYFNDSFPEAYGVKPQAELSNKPELLLPESAREGKDVAPFALMGADAVVARLGLSRK